MIRVLSAIALLAALAATASTALAMPNARLSWDACAPVVNNRTFTGQQVYEIVISGTGWDSRYRGHRFDLIWHAPGGGMPPDLWKLGPDGCTFRSNFPGHTTASADASCPGLGAPDFLDLSQTRIPFFNQPPDTPGIRLVAGFPGVDGVAATRYTLWRVLFDLRDAEIEHDPNAHCGDAEAPLCFQLIAGDYTDDLGFFHPVALENTVLGWHNAGGDCLGAVPVRPATWGALRAQYR
jgi:hypothetical protein